MDQSRLGTVLNLRQVVETLKGILGKKGIGGKCGLVLKRILKSTAVQSLLAAYDLVESFLYSLTLLRILLTHLSQVIKGPKIQSIEAWLVQKRESRRQHQGPSIPIVCRTQSSVGSHCLVQILHRSTVIERTKVCAQRDIRLRRGPNEQPTDRSHLVKRRGKRAHCRSALRRPRGPSEPIGTQLDYGTGTE